MKFPIPQLVINEFEMAVQTGCLALHRNYEVSVTRSDFGLMLLERIAKACEIRHVDEFEAIKDCKSTDEIVDEFIAHQEGAKPELLTTALVRAYHPAIVKTLDAMYAEIRKAALIRIYSEVSENGIEATLTQLLVEPMLPFQVFPVGGAENLEERIRKATDGSAAYDIIAQDEIVVTGEAQFIKLGFKTRMDYREAAMLLPRSGHGVKWGFALVNTVGLIDSDYPDEWMAKIYLNDVPGVNVEKKPLVIPKGERLAQFVIVEPKKPEMVLVHDEAELRPTGRLGGFGSSNVYGESKPS